MLSEFRIHFPQKKFLKTLDHIGKLAISERKGGDAGDFPQHDKHGEVSSPVGWNAGQSSKGDIV